MSNINELRCNIWKLTVFCMSLFGCLSVYDDRGLSYENKLSFFINIVPQKCRLICYFQKKVNKCLGRAEGGFSLAFNMIS